MAIFDGNLVSSQATTDALECPIMLRSTATLCLLTLVIACVQPQPETSRYLSDSRVDTMFSHYTIPGSPGAAVMVIKEGEILHAGAYGLANLDTGLLLTPETPVRLASVSKQFFTMAIMLLVEQESLSYDDPVSRWIPELGRFPGVTIRHMMNHTSGLPDYYAELLRANPQLDDDPLLTNAEAATIFETWGEADFPPGDRYQYSNTAYEMLALVIERITGQSVKAFMKENIFDLLEMHTAEVRDRRDIEVPNSAVGYSMNEDSTGWVEDDDNILNGLVGGGGIYASLLDMYAWDQALYEGGVVAPAMLAEAFRPTTLNDGSTASYGFGWVTWPRNGHPSVGHSGGWVGFQTSIDRYTAQQLTVIVLTNSNGDVERYRDSVAQLFLP